MSFTPFFSFSFFLSFYIIAGSDRKVSDAESRSYGPICSSVLRSKSQRRSLLRSREEGDDASPRVERVKEYKGNINLKGRRGVRKRVSEGFRRRSVRATRKPKSATKEEIVF